MLSNEALVPFTAMPRLFAPLVLACKYAADRCCGDGEGAERLRQTHLYIPIKRANVVASACYETPITKLRLRAEML
jgi:hypothetical protein